MTFFDFVVTTKYYRYFIRGYRDQYVPVMTVTIILKEESDYHYNYKGTDLMHDSLLKMIYSNRNILYNDTILIKLVTNRIIADEKVLIAEHCSYFKLPDVP